MLETVRGLQDVRVPAAPVSTMAELYNDEHLKSASFSLRCPPAKRGEAPVFGARRAVQVNRDGMVDAPPGAASGRTSAAK